MKGRKLKSQKSKHLKQKQNENKTIYRSIFNCYSINSFYGYFRQKHCNCRTKRRSLHFLLSKPTTEYEYLGSVKKVLAWSGKPEEMLNSMIKKVKKEYPKADGIVFTNIDMDKADAIQFKEK